MLELGETKLLVAGGAVKHAAERYAKAHDELFRAVLEGREPEWSVQTEFRNSFELLRSAVDGVKETRESWTKKGKAK